MGNLSGTDLEYQVYTLGDIGVIELLISYRYKYDENLFLDDGIAMAVTGAARLNEEVIHTYVSLDRYIEKCNFSREQLEMIRMVGEGYSHEEIAFELKLLTSTITGRLRTIYKRIVKENEWQWRKSIYTSKLDLKTKQCSKCKEKLPATVEFYYEKDDIESGFHSRCKMCF